MLNAVAVFLCQLFHVFLLGMQQQNVIHRRYVGAATVSLVLGVTSYFIAATIAVVAKEMFGSVVSWAYILAGPVGICFAMWFYERMGWGQKPRVECDKCRVHRNQLFYSRHERNGRCE